MKILHVETGRHFYGGAQQVLYLLRGLQQTSVKSVLVCIPGSELGAQARALGVTVCPLASAGDLDLRFAWRLRKVIARERPDLVHCHSRRGADFLGGFATAIARVPAVVSRRVDHPEPAWLARLRYRPFRTIIAISANIAAVLAKTGIDPARLTVIRSAVDSGFFETHSARRQLRDEFGLAGEHFVVACIGQLIPRKGHRYLLEAMAGLAKKAPHARLIVFGQGKLEAELRAQAARLNLHGLVQFAGFRQDLDRYVGGFDLVVHPALREGLGVSTLKAAAAGVAVVAFAVAGSREAVIDGRTGILVPPPDIAALEDAILALVHDKPRREALGAAARQRVREEFSIETMVAEHISLYHSLLDGPGNEQRIEQRKGQPGEPADDAQPVD